MSYYQIILKVLEIADESPELIDFYWPQILHIHTLESANRTPASLMKLGKCSDKIFTSLFLCCMSERIELKYLF